MSMIQIDEEVETQANSNASVADDDCAAADSGRRRDDDSESSLHRLILPSVSWLHYTGP